MPIPTFTPDIPQPGQSLGATNLTIKNNFGNYNGLISVDHVAPNGSGQGQHAQVTLNTYGSFPFTPAGTESFIGSFNASAAGSQLVYQPSIVSVKLPISPRVMGRANLSAGTWSAGNGPYGAGTSFNVGSISSTSATLFVVNFSQVLTSTDYFVQLTAEYSGSSGGTAAPIVTNKAVGSVSILVSPSTSISSVTFMVF